ncbi:hypothetical protein WOB59_03525 [Methylocystis sp. IM4]|uniref:hypothetical protein n=1 Tax=Methylocystis sp. IM4 TaxID=3136560 RepID=UPI00311921D5
MVAFVVAVILVLGAWLVASGILSFLDIYFFKTTSPERVTLAGGLSLIVLGAEFIFACSHIRLRFLH